MNKNGSSKAGGAAKPKKLSKWAEWWIKHPEGSDLKILDIKAVLR